MMKDLTLYMVLVFTSIASAQTCDSRSNNLENIYSIRISKCRHPKNKISKGKDADATIRSSSTRRGYSKRKMTKLTKTVSVVNNKVYNSRVENIVVNSKVYEFSQLDVIPLFKEDKHKDLKADLASFSKRISKQIKKSLKKSEIAKNNSTNTEVLVEFEINSQGKVRNIKATGPKSSKVLVDEAKNIIKNIEDFKPALKNGEPVNSIYYMSIPF